MAHLTTMLRALACAAGSALPCAALAQGLLGGSPAQFHAGGVTLPAIALVGSSFYAPTDPAHSARLTPSPDGGSLFAAYNAQAFGGNKAVIGYCQAGSGTGRAVFIGTQPANGSCPDFSAQASGFGAPVAVPDFAISDQPLSASDYSTVLKLRGNRTQPVQFPLLAAAIGIVYHNADVKTQLALDDAQLCGLFSGAITDWSQLGAYPAKPLRIVYRSDGSSGTFALSNRLSSRCPVAGKFQTDVAFTRVVSPLPPSAIAASGNPGVLTAIAATDGSLGYADLADARLRSSTLHHARLNRFDPLEDLGTPALVTVADSTLAGVDPATGRPQLAALNPAPAGRAGCILVATPDSQAAASGYPLFAVVYALGYYSGNPDFRALRGVFGAAFDAQTRKGTTTIGAGTGFGYLANDSTRSINRCLNR